MCECFGIFSIQWTSLSGRVDRRAFIILIHLNVFGSFLWLNRLHRLSYRTTWGSFIHLSWGGTASDTILWTIKINLLFEKCVCKNLFVNQVWFIIPSGTLHVVVGVPVNKSTTELHLSNRLKRFCNGKLYNEFKIQYSSNNISLLWIQGIVT